MVRFRLRGSVSGARAFEVPGPPVGSRRGTRNVWSPVG
jgi:hypothetical protein